MMIFDPMMLHSESVVTTPESRYVLFQNFFDIAAADQALPMRGSSAPSVKFPPVFRNALPENRRSLLGKQSRFCASEHGGLELGSLNCGSVQTGNTRGRTKP